MTWLPDDFSPDSKDAEVDRLREKLKIATAALEVAEDALLRIRGYLPYSIDFDGGAEALSKLQDVLRALKPDEPRHDISPRDTPLPWVKR